jgi:hypothetical protein
MQEKKRAPRLTISLSNPQHAKVIIATPLRSNHVGSDGFLSGASPNDATYGVICTALKFTFLSVHVMIIIYLS